MNSAIKVNTWWTDYLEEHPKFTGCLIDKDNDKAWFKNGKLHREDGQPAVECANGNKAWYKNGKQHREDGPARECANGNKAWYLNGKKYSEEAYRIAMRKIKLGRVLKKIDNENNRL